MAGFFCPHCHGPLVIQVEHNIRLVADSSLEPGLDKPVPGAPPDAELHRTRPGASISRVAEVLLERAKRCNRVQATLFNDQPLIIRPTDTVGSIAWPGDEKE